MVARARGERTKHLIVSLPPRHGKALEVSTPVPTPSGWKMIGELQEGEFVFDENGCPTRVVALSTTWRDRALYRISGKETEPIWADAEHEWRVRLDRKHGAVTCRTSQYLAERISPRRPLIVHHPGLRLDEDVILPLHPWLLGMWLGDGHRNSVAITSGDQDRPFVVRKIESLGYKVSVRSDEKTLGVLGIKEHFHAQGLMPEKFIPRRYLRASRQQRLELLQGLVDSDGHVAPDGQIEYCSIDERLAGDVAELVRTLGVKCNVLVGRATLNGRDCGPKYRVMFYMASAASLPRKAERCRDGIKQPGLYVDVIQDGRGDTVCIQVAAESHMFLAGRSMVPTCNSSLISHWFPVWYLNEWPDREVILVSYEADFAATWGRRVRNTIQEHASSLRVSITQDSFAGHRWSTVQGGSMVTAGVGGPITGRGAHALIIDDPVKNWEQAASPTYREKTEAWFDSTALTRLEPGGFCVVVMTRWHEDDLVGRILAKHSDTWEEIRLPALAEPNEFLGSQWDVLGRAEGEALWPERYDEEKIYQIQRSMPSRMFAGLFQQRPAPEQGSLFQRDTFRYWQPSSNGEALYILQDGTPIHPKTCTHFATVDLAIKAVETADYTVVAVWAYDRKTGSLLLIDRVRQRMEAAGHEDLIRQQAARHNLAYVAIESTQYQMALVQKLRRGDRRLKLPPMPVRELKAKGDKVSRAVTASAMLEGEQVYWPRHATWLNEWEEELLLFPNGKLKDQVDVFAYAALEVAHGRVGSGRVPVKVDLSARESPWRI